MNTIISTIKKERYFKTEIIASFIEVCYFGGFNYEEIFDFASFITGENVDSHNIVYFRNTIMEILNEQYPELKRDLYLRNGDYVSEKEVNKYINSYKSKYGNYMLIKSIKKQSIKRLELNKKNI